MSNLFPSPNLHLLGRSGQWVRVSADQRRWMPDIVLLGRELCTFELFHSAGSKGAGRKAAELYARTAAPHARSGVLMAPSGSDWAIWWWDLDVVEPLIRQRFGRLGLSMAPEALARPAVEGWRQTKVSSGWDVQLRLSGALRFSQWRRTPLDAEGFERLARLMGADSPAALPTKADPPYVASLSLLWRSRPAISRADLAKRAAVVAAVGVVAVSLGLTIRAGRIEHQAIEIEQQAAVLRADADPAEVSAVQTQQQRLAEYARFTTETNPVGGLALAIAALQLYDISPVSFQSNQATTTLTIPYDVLPRSRELAAELEHTGAFSQVHLATTPNRGGIQIQMTNQVLALTPNRSE